MRQKGFSLIELLIVIGILAIITTVVIANYTNYRRTSQLDITAQSIISTLRDAQSRSVAAKEGYSYGVYFQQNAGSDDQYFLFQGDSYAGGTVLETFTVPSILNLSTIDFSGLSTSEVVFDKLTGTTANPGYVTGSLTNPSANKIIAVNSEGQIAEVETPPSTSGIPGSFSLDTPTDGTIITTVTPTFTWDPAANATSYTLWHSTDPSYATYTEVTGITAHPTNPSHTLGAGEELENQARNYWKVKAIGTSGERWSDEKDWYVNVGINDPPDTFALVSPDDGVSETTTLTPTFDWEDTTDPNGSPITYTLEHSTSSSFPGGSTTSITGISLSQYTLQQAEALTNHTTNYWRVIAEDELGLQTICSDGYRTLNVDVNLAPGAFNLLSPTDGAYANTTTPTLDWEDAIDPNPGNSVTYTVWYSTDPTFSTKDEVTGLTSSTYTIASPLSEGVTYYWRVRAEDNHGASNWANQTDWDFYTNRQPNVFDLISPTNGASEAGANVIFDWDDTTDPDVGDTVTYHIVVDDDIGFGSPVVDVSGLTSSTYTAGGIPLAGIYYWKVEAVDNHSYGRWSNQTWSFTRSADTCDWHVDQSAPGGGDGSSWGSAFQTIGDAVSAMSGGDEVCIANGTYSEQNQIGTGLSGSAGDYTKFVNRTGHTNVIIAGSAYGIRLNGADYVEINGLKFSGATENIRLRNGANNNLLTNLELYGGSYGLRIQTSRNNDNEISETMIRNNSTYGVRDQGNRRTLYHDVDVYDNTGTYGFYSRGTRDMQLYNMKIYNNDRGLYLRTTRNSLIHDNEIYNNSGYNGFNRTRNTEIYDNEFRGHTSNWAIYLNRPRGVIIHNNLLKGNSDGLYSRRSNTGTHIYNNTIYGDNGGDGLYLRRFNGSTTVRNNLITNNDVGFRVANGNANFDNDYADVWGNTSNFAGQGATYVGANSISQDPVFVNPGTDFNLQASSPCINRGDPNPIYNDPDGSRSDIGAFPYTP